MDEQPLDRDAIRRLHARNVKGYCMTCESDETFMTRESDETGCDIPALLDLLEQTEEALTLEQERSESFDRQADTLMAERDVARRELAELRAVQTERDANASGVSLLVSESKQLREQVARLTEERDALHEVVKQTGLDLGEKDQRRWADIRTIARIQEERDTARLERNELRAQVARLTEQRDGFNEVISRVQAERDVARQERNSWETRAKVALDDRDIAEAQVVRLTNERDDWKTMHHDICDDIEAAEARVLQLQTALERLAGLLDPKVPPAPEPYLRQVVDDALAAGAEAT